MSSRSNTLWKLSSEVCQYLGFDIAQVLMIGRDLCRWRQRKRYCRVRLRETIGDEAPGHSYHTLQNRSGRHPCLSSLRRAQRRCQNPCGQSTTGSAITSINRRRPCYHRIHHQVHSRCPAKVYSEWWCTTVRHQHAGRGIRQGRQDTKTLPDRAIGYLLSMVSLSSIPPRHD